MSNPAGVVYGNDGYVYVLNNGNNLVQVFTSQGVYLRQFGVPTSNPQGMLQGPDGNLYISDAGHKQVDVVSTQGVSLSTIGANMFGSTQGMAFGPGPNGNLYVADPADNVVREYQVNGTAVTVFGTGATSTNLGDLRNPQAVAVDGSGNVYVWDQYNTRVEVFNSSGLALRTWGQNQGQINIYQMKFDSNGFLWETDEYFSYLYVYDVNGNLRETFGSGGGGGAGQFNNPWGMDFDPSGNVYVADWSNQRVDKWYPCGMVPTATPTVVTGPPPCVTNGFSWSGNMSNPAGVVYGNDGYVYVLNNGNNLVQVFTSQGVYLRQFGVPTSNPQGMLQGPDGNLYISDAGHKQVDVVSTQGVSLSTIGANVFGSTQGMAFGPGPNGNLYVADPADNVVREFSLSTHAVLRKFGSGNETTNLGDLRNPQAVAVDGSGNVYVWDQYNTRVEVFNSSGLALRTWGQNQGQINIYQMKFDSNGFLWETDEYFSYLYVYDVNGNLRETFGSGGGGGAGQFNNPWGMDFDPSGNVYVADWSNQRVDKWYPCGMVPTATPTVVTGPPPCVTNGFSWSGNMSNPAGVVYGNDGYVYVLNNGNNLVQVFTSQGVYLRQFGVPTSNPQGMLQGPDGNLYISDAGHKQVDVVSTQGVSLSTIGANVFGSTQGMAFGPGPNGNLYVADPADNVVREYQVNGTAVTVFGTGATSTYLGDSAQSPGGGGGRVGQRVCMGPIQHPSGGIQFLRSGAQGVGSKSGPDQHLPDEIRLERVLVGDGRVFQLFIRVRRERKPEGDVRQRGRGRSGTIQQSLGDGLRPVRGCLRGGLVQPKGGQVVPLRDGTHGDPDRGDWLDSMFKVRSQLYWEHVQPGRGGLWE